MKFQLLYDHHEWIETYHTILIVEPDRKTSESILEEFRKTGFSAVHYEKIEDAIPYWENNPDVLGILDESQLLIRGQFVADYLKERGCSVSCAYIILAKEPDYRRAVRYLKKGALDYLVKDQSIAEFLPGLVDQHLSRLNSELELQRSQAALLENEIELRLIMESIEDILIKIDLQNICSFISPGFTKILCRPISKQIGKSLFTFVHPDDVESVQKKLMDVVSTRNIGKFEFRVQCNDESSIWVEAFGTPQWDESKTVHGTILTLRDINHRKMVDRQLSEERNFISTVLDNVGSLITILDAEGTVVRFNRASEMVTGFESDEVLGEPFWNLLAYDWDRQRFAEQFEMARNGEVTEEFESRFMSRDGKIRTVRMVLTRISADSVSDEHIVCTGIDITSRIVSEERLRQSEERWQFALEGSGDGVRDWNLESGKMIFSAQWKRMLGFADVEAPETREFWESRIHPDDREMVIKSFNDHLNGKTTYYTMEYQIRCRDGSHKWVLDRGKVMLRNSVGDPVRMVCTQSDITNRKIIEDEIRYMSFHDVLTGLYNRAYFEEEMNRLNTYRQLPISIIVGDVNGLKLINDAFGHDEGDRLIQSAAIAIRHSCRSDDIISRIGGDEFSILLPNTNEQMAEEIIDRIRENCGAIQHSPVTPSIALGYATKTSDEQEIRTIFKIADDQMYKSKLIESKRLKTTLILSLRKTLQERTPETGYHSERLKNLLLELGRRMGFSSGEMGELELLSVLHDIGKVAVPDHILNKPDVLDQEEWNVMQKHVEIGYRIASAIPELVGIADYILCHHERVDGTGYPQGLTGEKIPKVARALAVVDAYDSMTQNRPYRRALSSEDALAELERWADRQFDGMIVQEFSGMIREDFIETVVL